MNDSDHQWKEKWSRNLFKPAARDFHSIVSKYSEARNFSLFGSDEEPLSSVWLASLSEAAGDYFREGLKVFDYGCGAGRYCNFLEQRLESFQYYGVEKRGSSCRHGEKSILVANGIFRHDRRARFGFIGSRLEEEAIENVDVVILGSIFTHVDFREVRHILARLRPVIERGGKVVFSAFISDKYRLEGRGAYGFTDCYSRVWFEPEQLAQLANQEEWHLSEQESFLAQDVNLHRIFALNKCAEGKPANLLENAGDRFSGGE
jgi:SAM-dependent methyltransferase